MRVMGDEAVTVNSVHVRVEGSLSEVSVTSSRSPLRLRNTRGSEDVDDLLARSDLRVSASLDVDIPAHAISRSRDGRAGAPLVVLDAPPLLDGEVAQVALVEEEGELRWLFPEAGQRRFALEVDDAIAVERGVVGSVIKKTIRFLAIKAMKPVAQLGVRSLAGLAERRICETRVRAFDHDSARRRDDPITDPTPLLEGPTLLLIHGTISRTDACFGQFDLDWIRSLNRRYQGRVIAFDHPTLSVSPETNAEDFVEWVKHEVAPRADGRSLKLDILAHSRGGLVAREIASRASELLEVRSIVFVATPNNGTPLCDPAHLREFLDVWTNLIAVVPTNPVTDIIDIVLELVKDVALDIALDALPGLRAMQPGGAYLHSLNERETHQRPSLRAIAADFEPWNTEGVLRKLRDRVFDSVFGGAMNDLVVPTRSAYLTNGCFTLPATQRLVLSSDHAVDHSSYWGQANVLAQLDRWLTADPPEAMPPTPEDTSDPNADIEAALATADSRGLVDALQKLAELPATFVDKANQLAGSPVKRPLRPQESNGSVVLIPGIMGSLIDGPNGRVWINAVRLAFGAFAEMSLDLPSNGLRATGLNPVYAPLAARLAEHWDVHLFPFDWRLDMGQSANELDRFIRESVFERGKPKPVHLVAHSMGGLVARQLMLRHPQTWRAIDDPQGHTAGGRLVMLGTPNRGSYAIPLALAGEDMLVKALATVDVGRSREELSEIMATFPGMYQMLPSPLPWFGETSVDDDRHRLYDVAAWRGVKVRAELLEQAAELHKALAVAEGGSDETTRLRLVYVAGDDHRTPARVRVQEGIQHFGLNDAGDGRVTHRSGRLTGVETFYVRSGHGELVRDPQVLDAIDVLLATGTSPTLSPTPFARRGGLDAEPTGTPLLRSQVDPDPVVGATRGGARTMRNTRDLQAAVDLGTSLYLGTSSGGVQFTNTLRVRVSHASLEQADWPVIVGHYRGLAPQGAEGFLDTRLNGALTRHHQADDYPDEPGETLYVEATGRHPVGGIVIGLGAFGELTRAKLTRAVRCAALQHMLRRADAREVEPTGISSVLISTPGQYGLSVSSAVAAIVEGVVEAVIEASRLGLPVRLEELEIIELYELRAIAAVDALRTVHDQLAVESRSAVSLHTTDELTQRGGGRGGIPTYNVSGDGWPRFVIDRRLPPCPPSGEDDDDTDEFPCGDVAGVATSTLPRLEFTRLGRSAQVDRLSVDFDEPKVRAMIAAAVHNPRAVDTTYALFQMLFPHEEKLEVDDTDNLHLLVDEDTATIPWELLCGRGDGKPGQALALRSGLLRQLRPGGTGRPMRQNGRPPVGRRALVVGDPPIGDEMGRLQGARAEATLVADLLEREEYTVERHIFGEDADPEESWLAIQAALYKHPYSIVHFATHGHVDVEHPERSGLLIGPGRRLTALDLRQMMVTPDLAFLNACHVGTTGPSPGLGASAARANELAANLGLQLMRNGVKAVVVAGWAVDDRAAKTYAETLYRDLLTGEQYGRAVHHARSATEDGGRTNTWGAYQCYGDPGFTLADSSGGRDARRPVSARDLIQALEALEAKSADAADLPRLRRTHREVVELDDRDVARFPASEVYEALGGVYRELGAYEDAVWAFREAIRLDRSNGWISPRSVEYLAHMEANLAAQTDAPVLDVHHRLDGQDKEELFDTALARLARLIEQGETAQRRRLLGGVNKKRAVLSRASLRDRYLANAIDEYRRAFTLILRERHALDADSGLIWVQLVHVDRREDADVEMRLAKVVYELIDRHHQADRGISDRPLVVDALSNALGVYPEPQKRDASGKPKARSSRSSERLAPRVDALDRAVRDNPMPSSSPPASRGQQASNFWQDATEGDLALTRLIVLGASDEEPTSDVDEIVRGYLDAFPNRSNPRTRSSVTNHLRDLERLLGDDDRTRLLRQARERLTMA